MHFQIMKTFFPEGNFSDFSQKLLTIKMEKITIKKYYLIRILQEICHFFQFRKKIQCFLSKKWFLWNLTLSVEFYSNFVIIFINWQVNVKKTSALSGQLSFSISILFIYRSRLLNNWFWLVVSVLTWRHWKCIQSPINHNRTFSSSAKNVMLSCPHERNTELSLYP